MLNKTLKYSLLLATAALSSTAFAESTVSVGYAYSKIEDVKLKGVNAQYRYEWDSPVNLVVSASYLKGDNKLSYTDGYDMYHDEYNIKQFSLLAGPEYKINDFLGVYALAGFAHSKIEGQQTWVNSTGHTKDFNDSLKETNFAYGVGVKINPIDNVSVNLGYEGTMVDGAKAKGFNIGVGYRF